jgi:hypothetical protein
LHGLVTSGVSREQTSASPTPLHSRAPGWRSPGLTLIVSLRLSRLGPVPVLPVRGQAPEPSSDRRRSRRAQGSRPGKRPGGRSSAPESASVSPRVSRTGLPGPVRCAPHSPKCSRTL